MTQLPYNKYKKITDATHAFKEKKEAKTIAANAKNNYKLVQQKLADNKRQLTTLKTTEKKCTLLYNKIASYLLETKATRYNDKKRSSKRKYPNKKLSETTASSDHGHI